MLKTIFSFLFVCVFSLISTDSFAAFSATKQREGQVGGLKVLVYEVNFASVTAGTTVTGLNRVVHAHFTNEVSDNHGITNKNSATASVTEDDPGQVHISSVTSNDTGTLIVFGH